ncbi:hypothetical protein J4479_05440 [Candidatus Woesearchaeota archaeon]|nr:hypothetical protein [Candidatus Woesearchaeota archaeon]
MQISFFEEFPTKENLARIKFLQWPAKLYLAAPSLTAFKALKQKIKSKNITQVIYWPVLDKKEGYWISPISDRKALLRIFEELWGKNIPVMLDLEIPSRKKIKLYFKALANFKDNKQLIRNFINNYKAPIYLAEYYPEGGWKERMLEWWGLHYNNGHVRVIKMMYRSMHHFSENTLKKECRLGLQQHGKKFCIALGTIATGVNGHEPLLSGLQLRNDLKTAKKLGVSEGIIFRLGGLNEVHQKNISEALEMENNFRDIKQFVRKAQPPQLEIIRELTANKEKKTKKNFVKEKTAAKIIKAKIQDIPG